MHPYACPQRDHRGLDSFETKANTQKNSTMNHIQESLLLDAMPIS